MAQRQWGVTPPISTEAPTPAMIQLTASLHEELEKRNQYEPPSEARHREIVLGRLSEIVKLFVQRAALKNGASQAAAAQAGGKIFTFGSYRLGVHGPGADIDTLCVVPKNVSREDFFTIFEDLLRQTEGVEELSSVPDAYVPIIKMKYQGVEIDLLFARLALHTIPEELDLRDDNLLKNLDERCVRSLGGSRVTDEILRLVPNVATFREALRTIKLWAKRRAIYSNVMGFLGGVAWAMLVARICQLYPNNIAGGIVSRFFLIMHQWSWPAPVILKNIEDGPLPVRVWNPKVYPSDKSHRMPIITPAYPAMCSTHNVTVSTQHVMTEEFRRASHIVDRIAVGQAQWAELFAPHDFFIRYKHYLQVTAASSSADMQLKWSGTVESKIRHLVGKLETVDVIRIAHPYVKGFERVFYCLNSEESAAVMNGVLSPDVAARTKEGIEGVEGATPVWVSFFFIGLLIETPKVAGGGKRLDLSYPTNEFLKLARSWDKYDALNMTVAMRTVKSAHLPDFVYENGERQAAKPVKRSKSGAPLQVRPRCHSPASAAPASASRRPASGQASANGNSYAAVADPLVPEGQPFKKPRASSFIPESANAAAATSAAITLPNASPTPSAPSTPAGETAKRLQRLSTEPQATLADLNGNAAPQPPPGGSGVTVIS